MTVGPWVTNTYGYAGVWCWIDNSDTGKVLRFTLFYIPAWVLIGYIAFCYAVVIYFYRKTKNQVRQNFPIDDYVSVEENLPLKRYPIVDKKVLKMLLFPTIITFSWIFASIQRTYQFFRNDTIHWIFFCEVVASGLRGFLDAIAYSTLENISCSAWYSRICGKRDSKTSSDTTSFSSDIVQ